MSSTVTVIDFTARRHVIKVTPGIHLQDVLEQACKKFGVDPNQYELKGPNNKSLDLSRTFRLSGLSAGAKLQLTILSRSPTVVYVALQLPESEAQSVPQGRFTEKFSSTTTLWLILRAFESGDAGGHAGKKNFTARGVPRMGPGGTGAGRLYYETPVIQVMGRKLSSFTDLQKTLSQLGFKNGSASLRLSFQISETPLEEAIAQIGDYFKSVDGDKLEGANEDAQMGNNITAEGSDMITTGAQTPEALLEKSLTISEDSKEIPEAQTQRDLPITDTTMANDQSIVDHLSDMSSVGIVPGKREITVFAPPSSTTPQAARHAHNPADYEPTLYHVKLHQARLKETSYNKRIPTHAEEAAQIAAEAKRKAEVKEVEIKIRFPDLSSVVSKFTNEDTAETLYDFVRGVMDDATQPFLLNVASAKGPKTIPKGSSETLIAKLEMVGRVLVNFLWDEGTTLEAKNGGVLKKELAQVAKAIEVNEVQGVEIDEAQESGKGKDIESGKRSGKGGVPKWLKLPGKK